MNLLSQTATLVFFARTHPQALDALKPNIPLISKNVRNVLASAVIKSIAEKVTDADTSKQLYHEGKSLFKASITSVNYDDDFWPLHPKPYYGPQPEPWFFDFGREEVMLNPQPLPPHEQSYYGALITMLADAVSLDKVSENLRDIGASLMKQPVRDNEMYASKSSSFSSIENGK